MWRTGDQRHRALPVAGAESPQVTGAPRFSIPSRWSPWLFAPVAAALLAAGTFAYREQVAEAQTARETELVAISGLKVSQAVAWRQERLAAARIRATAPDRVNTVAQWLQRPHDPALRARVIEMLEHARASHAYRSVWLATAAGTPLIAVGAPVTNGASSPADVVARAVAARDAVMGQLTIEAGTEKVLVDVAAPMIDRAGRLLAVLVVRDVPEDDPAAAHSFPLLQSWPTPSRTAETLVVRRDGDSVLYMNRLRHWPAPPLTLRKPLSATDLVAVQAVRGATGIVHGRDYRGVPVLAVVGPVPESDWILISKVDEEEFYADARWRGYTIAGATVGGVALATLLAMAIGGRRRRQELLARLHAERARREALEGSRATLRSIGDAVISTDTQGRVRQMNPVAERLTGWSEAEAVGRPLGEVLRVVDERTRAPVDCPVKRVLRSGDAVDLTRGALLLARDGTERPIADSGAPVRNEDGDPIGVVIVFRDQTAERAAQEKLAASEARLRLVLDTEPECVKLAAPDGRLLDINAAGLRMIEADSREQVLGRPIDALIHPADRGDYADLHRRALAGEAGTLSFRITGLKGTERCLEIHSAPFREAGGAVTAVLSVTRDVSELRHRQRTAALEASLLEAVSTGLPLAAVLRKTCLGVEAMFPGALASVLLVDRESGRLTHGAAPSLPDDYLRSIDGIRPGPNAGSCGTAVHRREAVIVEDIACDPLWKGHEKVALAHGLRACWSMPVLDGAGEAAATFAVYYRQPRRPSAEQLDAIGRVARIVGIAIERHRHDEALRESEVRFRQIAENIRDVFSIGDAATGRIFYVSPAYQSIWGRKAAVLYESPRDWLEAVHPEDRERMRRASDSVAQGAEYDETYRIVRPDGELRWIHGRGYPVRDARGKVHRKVGIATDITARRQAEAQLHKLSQAMEQSSESIVITDTRGRIEYVNEAFARNSGYSREEVLGRSPRLLQSGKTPRATYESLWATLRRGEVWRGEFINRRKDGSEYIEAALISPIKGPDGTVTHYLATKEDITARRGAERELERYRQHLEELVAERTRELEAAREQAEAANRSKSAFLANMSHEIRTPMNGVLGMLDVLEHGRLTEQQREMVRTARDSGRTLLAIIDDILDFSKIEAGQMHVERAPVAVADVVESLAESLLPLALRKDVELSVYVDPWLPRAVAGDALRLRQILFNLAGNAIKFSAGRAERRGRVAVRVTAAQRAPFALSVAVIDNGIGMSEETLARLFTPFTQAEASTTRRYGGTGLGLTICKRLADLLGGRIDVASRLGEGSTFTLILPCEVLEAAPAPAPFDLSGVRCLVLQAPGTDTEALAAYLQHAGARVQTAANAEQAAAMAAKLPAPVVAIRDAGAAQPSCEPALQAVPHLRHVVLTRGRRRRARLGANGVITLDSTALRRAALLRAVVAAAGGASLDAPTEDATTAPPAAPAPSGPTAARILVAEDDEINRLVIRQQLEVLGHTADFAVDGTDALHRWQHGDYALLLTDVHMPGVDGYALTRTIRAQEAQRGARRLPIVALTANAMRGEAERAKAAGMDDYLTKPLRIDVLREALQRWLAPSLGEAAPIEAAGEPTFDANALARTVGGDAAAMRELLVHWRAAAALMLAEMRDAAGHDDRARVATLAHRLKSSSRAVGAAALGGLCERLENAVRTGDNAAIGALLERVVEEHAAAEALLIRSDGRAPAAAEVN